MSKKRIIKRKRKQTKKEVFTDIITLFEISKENFPSLISKNAITTALNYSKKYKVKIPKEIKREFCKNCLNILIPGNNSTTRFSSGKKPYKIITCLNCGKVKRIGYSKEEKQTNIQPNTQKK